MDIEQVIKIALFLAPIFLLQAWYFGKSSKDIYYEEVANFHKGKIESSASAETQR